MFAASSPNPAKPPSPWAARAWRLLLHPWLSLTLLALSLVLVAALFLLPQLPAQLLGETGGAARWLASAASRHGVWGKVLVWLGLHDVMHSPLLWLCLLAAATAIAAQLAEAIATVRQIAGWRTHAPALTSLPGAPLDARRGPAHAHRQLNVAASTGAVSAAVAAYAAARFDSVMRRDLAAAAAQPSAVESVFVCLRNPGALRLRVLLPAGLLIALAGVVAALLLGWQSVPPLLAPGAVYRDGLNNLQIVYAPPTGDNAEVSLVVRLGEHEGVFRPQPGGDYAIGPAPVHVDGYRPGLWLTTSDSAGRRDAAIAAGIACAAPGDEDSLLVPSVGAGLRIICAGSTPEFRVELYQSDSVGPVFATEVLAGQPLTVPLTGGLDLHLTPIPALALSVSSFPQPWLAWLGIAVALVGAAGYTRPTGAALIQVAGWDATGSAVVVQAGSTATAQAVVDHVQTTVAAATPLAPASPGPANLPEQAP